MSEILKKALEKAKALTVEEGCVNRAAMLQARAAFNRTGINREKHDQFFNGGRGFPKKITLACDTSIEGKVHLAGTEIDVNAEDFAVLVGQGIVVLETMTDETLTAWQSDVDGAIAAWEYRKDRESAAAEAEASVIEAAKLKAAEGKGGKGKGGKE